MRCLLLSLAIAVACTGCAGRKGSRETARNDPGTWTGQGGDQKLIITPANVLAGRVIRVNRDSRFAVLSFQVGQMPTLQQRMNIYRSGLKVGELRISGPQRDDKIVGDVISGEAAVGDEVRDQ